MERNNAVCGAILQKGERYYTYLGKIFQAIGNAQLDYNWLFPARTAFR